MNSFNPRAFTDLAMANTDVVVGKALNVRGKARASFQMTWTGTPTGVFSFRVSNRPDACSADGTPRDATDATVWNKLVNPSAFTAQQPAGGATGPTAEKGVFGFADLCHHWLLPVYTNASGAGTGQGHGEAWE